jgi:hypothetical protein
MATKKSGKSVKSVKALPAKDVNKSQAGKVRGGTSQFDAGSGQLVGRRVHTPVR